MAKQGIEVIRLIPSGDLSWKVNGDLYFFREQTANPSLCRFFSGSPQYFIETDTRSFRLTLAAAAGGALVELLPICTERNVIWPQILNVEAI